MARPTRIERRKSKLTQLAQQDSFLGQADQHPDLERLLEAIEASLSKQDETIKIRFEEIVKDT